MGIPDEFIEHGSVDALLEEIGLTKTQVAETLRDLLPMTPRKGIGS